MIVIADTGPLNYLMLIGPVAVLQPLYKRVIVPQAAVQELDDASAPAAVRTWIAQPPDSLRSGPTRPQKRPSGFSIPASCCTGEAFHINVNINATSDIAATRYCPQFSFILSCFAL
jgi:hypothetical protein